MWVWMCGPGLGVPKNAPKCTPPFPFSTCQAESLGHSHATFLGCGGAPTHWWNTSVG